MKARTKQGVVPPSLAFKLTTLGFTAAGRLSSSLLSSSKGVVVREHQLKIGAFSMLPKFPPRFPHAIALWTVRNLAKRAHLAELLKSWREMVRIDRLASEWQPFERECYLFFHLFFTDFGPDSDVASSLICRLRWPQLCELIRRK